MAQENFAKAMKIELTFEGGKDDDPRDPGGRTNQGIIQRVYDGYRRRLGLPTQDVFKMNDHERDEIYKKQYFDKVRFDELPPGIDVVIVDGAINSGPAQSVKWVQRALGLKADGVLGETTLDRIVSYPDHDKLIAATLDRRRAFLRGLKPFATFGKGWLSRVAQLQKVGQAWAMGSVGPAVVYTPNGNKKADIVDAKPLPALSPPAALSGGGVVSTTLSSVQTMLDPISTNPTVSNILIGVAVGGAVITAIGAAWVWWAKSRRAELEDVLDLVQQAPGPADNDNVPEEVLREYVDPTAHGVATGNIAPGTVTTSGRTEGDTEVRVNDPAPVPFQKRAA